MTPIMLFAAYAVVLVVALYIFVYIPNKKKQRQMKELHGSLTPGDVVITMGGIVGTVTEVNGDYVTLLLDKNTGTAVLYRVSKSNTPEDNIFIKSAINALPCNCVAFVDNKARASEYCPEDQYCWS